MIAVYPTDTVYGIGCPIWEYDSIKKIYMIKGKGFKEPLSFAVNDDKEIINYADVSGKDHGKIKDMLKKGSHFTFLVKKRNDLGRNLQSCINLISKDEKIGIRVIKHSFDYPIISTSANIHGEKTAKRYEDLDERIIKAADIVIKGDCYYGRPSIVYDVANDRILRE